MHHVILSHKNFIDHSRRTNRPVEVPQDTGAVSANADEDAVGFTDEQACDLSRVTIQMNQRLHLHLYRLEKKMS